MKNDFAINSNCFDKKQNKKKIIFPRIAVKSRPGALIVRETEKIVDEKVIQRTEEVPCPITGQPQFRTVEYIEKVIETEVSNNTNSKKQYKKN